MTDQPIIAPCPAVSRRKRRDAERRRRSLLDDPRVLGWGSVALVLIVWS